MSLTHRAASYEAPACPLSVVPVSTVTDMERLKEDWDATYAADPQAHMFSSWWWVRSWIESTPYKWTVLVARRGEAGAAVGFAVFGATYSRWGPVPLLHELYFGTKPLGDYSGFVILPEYQVEAAAAFGRFVRDRLRWDRLRLRDVLDERLDDFLAGLYGDHTTIRHEKGTQCPFITLPATWDGYLQSFMSSKGRYRVRHGLREIEKLPGFRASIADSANLPEHTEALLSLWQGRWGQRSLEDLAVYRRLLVSTADCGHLWLRTIWDAATPVASLVAFKDPVRRTFSYYIGGFNREYASLGPGKVIVGWTIRDAIEAGYSYFDFLLGGEEYKTELFGAQPRSTQSLSVMRRGTRVRVGRWLLHLRDSANRGPQLDGSAA